MQSIYIIIIITNNYIFTSCYSVGSDNLHRPTSACVLITPGGAKLEAPPTFKAGVGHMKCPHLIRGSMGPLENAPQRTSLDRFSRFALLTLVSALSMHADTFLNLPVAAYYMQNISYTFELWVSHLASMSEMRLCMFVLKSHVDILTVT